MDILRQQIVRQILGKKAKDAPRAQVVLAKWLFDETLNGNPVANYLLDKRLGFNN